MSRVQQLIAELRALPRYTETEHETGIGMMSEVAQAPDGDYLMHEQVEKILARYDSPDPT